MVLAGCWRPTHLRLCLDPVISPDVHPMVPDQHSRGLGVRLDLRGRRGGGGGGEGKGGIGRREEEKGRQRQGWRVHVARINRSGFQGFRHRGGGRCAQCAA